jgi:hypothetical protein
MARRSAPTATCILQSNIKQPQRFHNVTMVIARPGRLSAHVNFRPTNYKKATRYLE